MEKVFRKYGYGKASDAFDRVDGKVIALCKRVALMKPRTLGDLAIQVVAFDLNRTMFEGESSKLLPPREDFALHFAKFCGVKLFRKRGGE